MKGKIKKKKYKNKSTKIAKQMLLPLGPKEGLFCCLKKIGNKEDSKR